MNASQWLEVATQVFVNCDQAVGRKEHQKMEKKVDMLAVALVKWSECAQKGDLQGRGQGQKGEWGEGSRSGPKLEWNQCAYCCQ